jgi:hypothetical protein
MTFDAPPPPPTTGYVPPAGEVPVNDHPVQLTIRRSESQSRVLALFSIPFFLGRLVLAIPVLIVLYLLQIAGGIVAWLGQWAILFTGRNPEGMHTFVVGWLRWSARTQAFMLGATDSYPPFRLSP